MSKASILVVDDNKLTRDSLKILLESGGYSVESCARAKDAIDRARDGSLDVFLIDYRMPEMNGDKVTAELRKLRPDGFIIGFSVESRERDFLTAGANVFITKDQLISQLIPTIEKRVKNSKPT